MSETCDNSAEKVAASARHRVGLSPRSARTALLWGLALFAGLQLALAAAIEQGLAPWATVFRDPWYGHKAVRLQHRLRFFEARKALVVVMLGSSRTGNGLRGMPLEAELERELGQPVIVFNLGVPGAGPLVELMNFERLLAEGVRPDLLLIEVMPVFMSAADAWESRIISADRLNRRDLDWLEKCLPVRALRRAWWQSRVFPWYAHRFAILSEVLPIFLPASLRRDWSRGCDESGWVPIPFSVISAETRRGIVERVRQEYEPRLRGFRLGGPSCLALRHLLEECRRQQIDAALVLMPEGSEFRSWYPPAALNEIDVFLSELSAQYGASVIDARSWVADEALCDSHHLLGQGASVFTGRLGREAILPLLKKGSKCR